MAAPLELYLLTFNCGRALIDPQLFGSHFFNAWPNDKGCLPDIIAISLQEVAPIAYAFLGGTYLAPYLARFEAAVEAAASTREERGNVYETLIVKNVGMTALLVLAKKEVKGRVEWIQTAGCGVGVWEMGNKGGVGVRIGIYDKELTFVAMHLAPMEGAVVRRNEDWKAIARGLVFENVQTEFTANDEREPLLSKSSIADGHGIYKPNNFIFLAGDLNYRTSHIPPSPSTHHTYPQPSSPQTTTAGGIGTVAKRLELEALLERDQLSQEMAAGRTLHGFAEMTIKFAPTYKYDNENIGISEPISLGKSDAATALSNEEIRGPVTQEPDRWTWARHRWPSWCDRILYLPPVGLTPHIYDSLPLLPSSDHRGVALSVTVPAGLESIVHGADLRCHPPFELSTDWRSRRATARSLEFAVGIASYLTLTYEGYAILVGLLGGAIGGYIFLKFLT